jgi:hypothetical protein
MEEFLKFNDEIIKKNNLELDYEVFEHLEEITEVNSIKNQNY